MQLTLRGETINIELGQEVTFYQYILNNDKVEFKEDKVVVNFIAEDNFEPRVAFRNEFHGATLLHYEMGNFYLSISDKNVLDFLTRKYKVCQEREEHLNREIANLVSKIGDLNNDKSKLETLIESTLAKLKEDN